MARTTRKRAGKKSKTRTPRHVAPAKAASKSASKAANPVKIMDTTLRDGHQCLIATRLRTEDMLPILAKMDSMGFAALEVWGGATFDAMHRFLY